MYHYLRKNIRYLIFPILVFFIGVTKIFSHDIKILTDYFCTDDTFYYLNTAWNLKYYDFVTFDGINKTNGLQLVWFFLLAFFQLFFSSKITFLYGTLLLCLLINVIQYRVIFLFTKLLKINYLYYFISIFWIHISLSNTFLSGMDNSIGTLILSLSIYSLCKLYNENKLKMIYRQNIKIILLLILLPFCRVDFAIYSILLYIYSIVIINNKINDKKLLNKILIINFSLALSGLIFMLLLFYKMGEMLLPVSGLIKQHYTNYSIQSIINTFVQLSHEVLYDTNVIFMIIKRYFSVPSLYIFILFLLCFTLLYAGCISTFRKNNFSFKKIENYKVIFLFTSPVFVLHQLYLSAYGGDLLHYCKWWQSGFYLLLIYIISFIFIYSIKVILKYSNLTQYKSFIFNAIIILFLIINLMHQYSYYNPTIYSLSPPYKYYKQCHGARIELSSWINSNIASDIVLGSYNAGTIGYFSNNSVINLDGLINGKEFYNILIDNSKDIITYLKKYNCRYIVDRKNTLKNKELLNYATLFKELHFDNCDIVYSIYRIND